MSKFKLEFTLKQHTPIIHFQAEQKGATLRATELKPKLDRFLIDKIDMLDDKGKPKEEYKSWFIGGGKEYLALDYKVKIININTKSYKVEHYGAYFGKDKAIKNLTIKVQIISFKNKVFKHINKYFESFISISSFGSRTNKGFGSFTLEETSLEKYQNILSDYYFAKRVTKVKNPLPVIKTYYQELKSGINDPYKNSKLMEFFYPEILWEKQWMKREIKRLNIEMFNDLKDDYHIDKNKYFNILDKKYKYIRPLLGMGYRFEFITKSFEDKIIEAKNADKEERRRLKQEAADLKIIIKADAVDIRLSRFKSPIIFKVFENYIYLVIDKKNPIDKFIFNQKFTFTAFYKKDKYNFDKHINLGNLHTPTSSEFNLLRFLSLEEEKGDNQ